MEVIIWLIMVNHNLVGGIPTPLKNMSSSVGMIFPFPTASGKSKKSLKTRIHYKTNENNDYLHELEDKVN